MADVRLRVAAAQPITARLGRDVSAGLRTEGKLGRHPHRRSSVDDLSPPTVSQRTTARW